MKENKVTADYTRKAVDKYRDGKTTISILVKPEVIDAIKKKYGENVKLATYLKGLVEKDLSAGADSLPWEN